MQQNPKEAKLMRLRQVLERFPVSRSRWWQGVRQGEFPEPIRLGSRCTMWRSTDIDQLIEEISE